LHAARFDSTQLKVLGTGVTVVQNVMSDASTGAAHFSTSDDGSLVYVPGGTWEAGRALRLVDRESGIQPPVGQFAGFRTPRWSLDGQRLAVMIEGATDSIWILHLGSNRLERLTFEAGANWAPVWTPDGARMAFASNMSGAFNIYWKSARGGEPSERLTTSAHAQFPSSWSPDGRILAYAESDPVTGSDLWVVSPSDGRTPKPFLKSDFNEYGAAFSLDG
jgi:Tol biopolymer transport system component